jgi:hypothetical protein
MDNQERIFEALEEQKGRCNKVVIPSKLIHMIGDLKAAAFLSQLIYWSDKGKRRDGYIYKSAKEWKAELGLSTSELTRVRGLVSPYVNEKKIKANGSPTIHYELRMEALIKAIHEFMEKRKMDVSEKVDSDLTKSDKSLTETTQKEQTQTTLGAPLSVYEDWKQPDDKYSDTCSKYFIQDRVMEICNIQEFEFGDKDEIKRIEKEMEESDNYSGPDKHRYDPEFVDKMLQWGAKRANDRKPIAVKMLLKAINNKENYLKWLNSLKHCQNYKPHKERDYGEMPYYQEQLND